MKLLGGARAPLAVSGFGVVTPAGVGTASIDAALLEGRSALTPLTRIRARSFQNAVGGEVAVTSISATGIGAGASLATAQREQMDGPGRATLLAKRALESLRLDVESRGGVLSSRTGLALGTALGDAELVEELSGNESVSTDEMGAATFDAMGASIASFLELSGPRRAFSATCVSSLCALERAAADLALGRADAMVVGSVDSLSVSMQAGFSTLRALSPSGELHPFDEAHDGIILGEGAAFVLLEPLTSARARGSRVASVLLSSRLRSDSYHITSPDPTGAEMARAIRQTLDDADLSASDIGCVIVTAAGSAVYDRMLASALESALGEDVARSIAVTTWEPAIGHMLAATGALAIAYGASIVESGVAPPIFGVERRDPGCRLDYVLDTPRTLESPVILSLVVGFGGQNGVVLQASPEVVS